METSGLHPVGEEWSFDDKFIIIGAGGDRAKALRDLDELWPGIEVVAPTEKRMLRPRRKSGKQNEPVWVERPLFLEYVAVRAMPDWHRMFQFDWLLFVLDENEAPKVLTRRGLQGMLTEAKKRSWEGAWVEIISGPMKGQKGIYEKGRIRLSLLGREVAAKVSPFDLFPIR